MLIDRSGLVKNHLAGFENGPFTADPFITKFLALVGLIFDPTSHTGAHSAGHPHLQGELTEESLGKSIFRKSGQHRLRAAGVKPDSRRRKFLFGNYFLQELSQISFETKRAIIG